MKALYYLVCGYGAARLLDLAVGRIAIEDGIEAWKNLIF